MIKKGYQKIANKYQNRRVTKNPLKFKEHLCKKNICSSSGCAVPCEPSKRSNCVETQIEFQIFVLEFTYLAYKILKYQFLIIFR